MSDGEVMKLLRRKYLNGQFCPVRATSFEGKHAPIDNMYAHCTFVVAKMLDFCVNAFVQRSGGRSAARLIVEMPWVVVTGRSLGVYFRRGG
jgi:hypothetical protein